MNLFKIIFQSHVHGDARRAEAEQQDGDEHDAGGVPPGPQDPGGVPLPHPPLHVIGPVKSRDPPVVDGYVLICKTPPPPVKVQRCFQSVGFITSSHIV